ncbi:TetR/AcrR family transcriptional regulator C-terminal domain-containing protein [Mycolicibacterium sp. ND9-15]|uniref:TetR/AcrR family transcriptional regulator n=1 Tax=Mycolicibacterium sp. ND9-15 TaxID=3042320 RepID=UPI002DD91AB6|nr:TetR/AcrR family transcriptional regulator C-terminal domain-containing protein [Mycolicibacterium sp. ND9-15]WSE54474.1 TetR/AcrR family transcriptional regulator C-terminal domain-containing protein [Mycolicibacterium sp. ND9-15]
MNGRTRGRPPRISRDQIVAAARDVASADLTMQAVADALGVSRKALHYYVGDREGLLTLVISDLFERGLTSVELPVDEDWRAVVRAYAVAFRDGLIQVGAATDFSRLRGIGAAAALALADRVLDALLTAGFSPDTARQALTAASNIAQSAAHSSVAQTAAGVHRHRAETSAALEHEPQETYPALRRVLASARSQRHDAEHQFDFELDALIGALDRLLGG